MIKLTFSPWNIAVSRFLSLATAITVLGCGHILKNESSLFIINPSSAHLLVGEPVILKACLKKPPRKSDSIKIHFSSSGGLLTPIPHTENTLQTQTHDNSVCSITSFTSKQPGNYQVEAKFNGLQATANLAVVNDKDIVLNLLPSIANLKPEGEDVKFEGFVTTSNGLPVLGAPVLFVVSGERNYVQPKLERTDEFGRAQFTFHPTRDTDVCFFLTQFRQSKAQCSRQSAEQTSSQARSKIHIERPIITQILPLSVEYKEGHIYTINLIGKGFGDGALAWVSNTPAEVVLSTRYRLLIRFPGPKKVNSIAAGGETIHVVNPKSGYSTEKQGFNFSGKL